MTPTDLQSKASRLRTSGVSWREKMDRDGSGVDFSTKELRSFSSMASIYSMKKRVYHMTRRYFNMRWASAMIVS